MNMKKAIKKLDPEALAKLQNLSYEEGEDIGFNPTDQELKDKLNRMAANGLTADKIKDCVVNFMKASPETFQDHLTLLEALVTMTEIESSN